MNFDPGTGATNPQNVNIDFSRLSQFAGDSTADVRTVDGYGEGELKDFTMNEEGVIIGSYDNGYNKDLARIGLANFSNPAGLQKAGDTMFNVSNNSGDPQVGAAGVGGRGTISSGTLEMSNVDLAEQFTKMITSQRGFQANSKMITTSDEMLQGLVNMKR
ncbi:MAG: flagellar hook-basal body complex protein [Halanaerobiales bacterium]|nr:flagellar hook-basal body complex protein [Halanaerobiales bacterium]